MAQINLTFFKIIIFPIIYKIQFTRCQIHGYEPQGKPWTLIPQQAAGYHIHAYAG